MKEIISIIRPGKVAPTRNALEELGFPGLTANAVLGRGRQRGIGGEITPAIVPADASEKTPGAMKYIPKRWMGVIVADEEVDKVVKTIIEINQTGQIGDGKIFICPIDNAVRVRTGESGNEALI